MFLQRRRCRGSVLLRWLGASWAPRLAAFSSSSESNGTLQYGSFHEVVGGDGVLMIHLEPQTASTALAVLADSRREASTEALARAGVFPIRFPATDAQAAGAEDLSLACLRTSEPAIAEQCSGPLRSPPRKMGSGCVSPVEQAIADSHRRALMAASERQHNWTAILEDDMVPAQELWSDSFRDVWKHIPEEAKFIRLGWCTFPEDVGPVREHVLYDGGHFRIIDYMQMGNGWYYTGGCTTGYIVHRSIISDLLKIFPCCSPIDSCLETEFFYQPAFCRKDMACQGQHMMVSIDAIGSTAFAAGRTKMKSQAGIIVQDNRGGKSTRPGFNEVG